jgi:NAD(P)-dependent dehydrogenase (short-subunit alcohol dehydrogenase family)
MTENLTFRERVAVVTGAGGALCSVMAKELARQGAKAALLGRTKEKLDRVKAEILESGGVAESFAVDVTDENALESARLAIEESLGTPAILINGAGGALADANTTVDSFAPEELAFPGTDDRGFFSLDLGAFRRVVEINLMGTVIPCRLFGRKMAASGRGVILNVASVNSFRGLTRVPAYAAAKAGVENFTRWLAAYLSPAGIRVNGIAPGFYLNDRNRQRILSQDGSLTPRGENIRDHTPLGRFGEPEELLGCMNWLLDETASSFVTGITVAVDGGFLAKSPV